MSDPFILGVKGVHHSLSHFTQVLPLPPSYNFGDLETIFNVNASITSPEGFMK